MILLAEFEKVLSAPALFNAVATKNHVPGTRFVTT
jgi:hypothetical protein